jgi:Domain of unknown function (DUF4399)
MPSMNRLALMLISGLLLAPGAHAGDTPAPANAYVYVGPQNDHEVINSCRVLVWFGLRNMGVAPAGVEKANTGHHHLLVDVDLPPMDQPIPNDRNHLHFGGGQTEVVIELPPGTHTLQLLMGDKDHVPHNPPVVSAKKTITVKC